MMKFDELIESIRACCKNDDSENKAYEKIRYEIACIKRRSHSAFDVKETFEAIAIMAHNAAREEAEEDFARRVIY